jgi:serine/threonine protein kinase
MYEMLSGKKIFLLEDPNSTSKITDIVVNVMPEPIGPSGIPEELRMIVMKLLEKDPNNRFPDARTVIEKIHEVFYDSEIVKTGLIHGAMVGTTGPLLSSPAAMLEDVVRLFLIDGSLTSSEHRELERRAERLGLSRIQAEAIEDKVREELNLPTVAALREFAQIAEAFYTTSPDMNISPEQIEFLNEKGKDLDINSKERNSILVEVRDRVRYKRLSAK